MTGVKTVTLGCRLNIVESEAMRASAAAAGETDLVIVNTCAVTAESVRQSAQAVRRERRARPSAKIVVTGCASMAYPERFSAMREIDRIIDNRLKTEPSQWSADRSLRSQAAAPLAAAHTRAFIDIQNGCDHRCTFCAIPFGRGPSRSRPPEEIIAAIERAVSRGAKEAVLTGVDLTSWGADLPGRPSHGRTSLERQSLGALVRAIFEHAPTLPRLRLSSIDCAEFDDDLWDVFASEERFAPYLHLSLQSGSNLILKRMKRRHSREGAIRLCRRAKELRPEAAIGSDLIVGFPTETEADFRQTLDLVRECGLVYLHVFPFSARPGTPAARMPQTPAPIIKDRAMRLRTLGDAVLKEHLAVQRGQIRRVLVERGGSGHAPDFARVLIDGDAAPGALVDVAITGASGHNLIGVPLTSRSDEGFRAYAAAPAP